tara:strand:+ start:11 stop:274 length:264 start_codon:yes stop_codon:yes gene_type:complete
MNPLINRIWDVWTNSPQDELFAILTEFREDYGADTTWLHAIDIIEEAVLNEEYDRAEVIFLEMRPNNLRHIDYTVFLDTLDDARWNY